jgi:hypothetical protein
MLLVDVPALPPLLGGSNRKKHYPVKSHHIKRLITHVEKGGVLEGHKDVPQAVRDELYREEQDRLGRDKRKGSYITGTGVPYQPININVRSPICSRIGHDVTKDVCSEAEILSV